LGGAGGANPSETCGKLSSAEANAERASPPEPEVSNAQVAEDGDCNAAVGAEPRHNSHGSVPATQPTSQVRAVMAMGLAIIVALGVLVGWLGFRVYQSHKAEVQRELFVQVARQGALNLTTVDWEHADRDVQ